MIIAVSGHNADTGLLSIAKGSKYLTITISITKDISVGLYMLLNLFIKCSVYGIRV